ncbi:MAG TPA: glycosyltransferase [Gaiellaceae bacterium]|nr:glycosyltransferase [Gaiellaceae bacterium]
MHVLLTRFNVLVGYGADPERRLDPAWLVERFRLFDRFCYPSVCAQTASFHWLVFFDAATPPEFKRVVELHARLAPVYVEGRLTDERIAGFVAERFAHQARYLLTTRLDNDDALGDDYMERVQSAFRGQDFEFLNVPLGYEWYRGHLYHRVARSNTFISLIERVPADGRLPTTVHCGPHDTLHRVGKVRQLLGPPRWLVTIHGGNAANELLGIRRLRVNEPTGFRRQGGLHLVEDSPVVRISDLFRSASSLLATPLRRRDRIVPRLRAIAGGTT